MDTYATPLVEVKALRNLVNNHWLHDALSFTVHRGEIIAIIGDSGCGKTTLLRSLLMLHQPASGTIKIFDVDIGQCSSQQANYLRTRWGVMFQNSALFSSLTLLENVMFPLLQLTSVSKAEAEKIARLKIVLVGLAAESAKLYPAELSGGMKKRGALARAIALDPELILLDEPTAGLDPQSAAGLDALLLNLRELLGLTLIMATHDLDTLWRVPDRVLYLGEGKILAALPMPELVKHPHPAIQAYFSSERSQKRLPIGSTDGH